MSAERMDEAQPVSLNGTRRRITVNDADLSGSTFDDVRLTQAAFRFRDANLPGVSIVDSALEGMSIDGTLVSDLMAAYRASKTVAG